MYTPCPKGCTFPHKSFWSLCCSYWAGEHPDISHLLHTVHSHKYRHICLRREYICNYSRSSFSHLPRSERFQKGKYCVSYFILFFNWTTLLGFFLPTKQSRISTRLFTSLVKFDTNSFTVFPAIYSFFHKFIWSFKFGIETFSCGRLPTLCFSTLAIAFLACGNAMSITILKQYLSIYILVNKHLNTGWVILCQALVIFTFCSTNFTPWDTFSIAFFDILSLVVPT